MVGQIKNLNLIKLLLLSFILVNVLASHSFAGPNRTTYQARIIKPDGYPLEAANVNFKFTILDPIGNCILYSETYSNLNMSSTGGMVSFALGSGVKSYPVSATTFEQVFSNITPNLSCDAGGPPSYSPTANDIRKIVMQFHDGSGWQTLPAMSINAVPYAMYANEASKLNGKSDSDFVQISSLPVTCGVSEAIRFNGTSFSCLPVGDAAVAVTSGSVTTALGYTPADDADLISVSSYASNVSSTVFSVSSTVSSLSNAVTSLSNSTAASFAAITSSQWVTSGTTISYNQGSIQVSGGVRISMDSVACASDSAGTLRYNGGLVEYCNGTSWSAFGVAGAGITSINGSTSGSQTFGIGTTGTLFNISSTNGVHTFNIPLAASSSVTAGLLSNADHTLFSNKMNATSAAIVTALGYTPANSSTLNALSSMSSSMASDLAAVSASLATTNSNLATTNSNVSAVSSALATTNSNISAVSAAVATANTNIAAVSSSLATTNSNLATANTTISSVSSTLNSLTNSTAASFAAITNSQWVSSGTAISYNTGHVGVTSMTATSAFTTPLIYGGTGISGNLRLESTTHSSKGYILMAQGSSGGNVGIGTNMPLAKLYVDSDGMSPNTPAAGSVAVFDNEGSDMNITLATAPWRKASINFANSGQPTRGSINYQFDNNPSLDKLSIGVNSASTIVLDAYNRMGIGTSNPTTMLGIQNTSDIGSFNIKAAPSQGAYWMRVVDSNDNQKFMLSPNGSMPSLMLGTTHRIQLTSEYGGINEVPANGAAISTTGNLSLINNGNPGVMTMAGYYNNSLFLSAWEIANVGSGFGNLLLMRSGGNVGVGVAAPNAKLHVGSGTATTAAIKIVSGTLLASPASGSIEYDGFNFYVTDGTNTRRAIATASAGSMSNVNSINSTGNLTLVPNNSVIVSSTAASINSQTGALVVNGGLGVAGNLYSSGTILTSSNIEGNGVKSKGSSAYLEMHDTDTLYSANPQSALIFRDSGNSQYSFMGPSNGSMLWNSWLPIELDTSSAVDLYVSMNGRVGIGTSSPQRTLDVSGTVRSYETLGGITKSVELTTDAGIEFMKAGTSYIDFKNNSADDYDARISSMGSNDLVFSTGGNGTALARMTITSSGSVGIGTSAPTVALDVSGTIATNSYFSGPSGVTGPPTIGTRSAGTRVVLYPLVGPGLADHAMGIDSMTTWYSVPDANRQYIWYAADTPLMTLKGNGYVGMGGETSPSSNIHVQTGISTINYTGIKLQNAFKTWTIGNNVPNSYNNIFSIFDGTTSRLWIGDTGNVGLGVTTPLEKLDVNGSVIARGGYVYMNHDDTANTNNDYMAFDDYAYNGIAGTYSFFADHLRGQSWTAATAAIAAKAGYFNQHVAINSTSSSHTLTVNGSMNAAGQVVETMSFAIDGTASGTWAIGSLSNTASTTHVNFEMQVHNNSTIDALRFQVSLPTYSNGAFYSGWQELPVAFGSSGWNGAKNYVIDVLRSSAAAGNPFYFRVRNKGGQGSSSTMRLRMTYNNENTFTRITHVNTVGTAFNASTAAAGGSVDGMYGALEYSFPVATGQAWRPADNTGLFIKNSGYVGIGTSSPSVELEVSGTVKAQAYLYTSDRRLKEEIITLPDALEKALQLRGVNFVWKNSKDKTVGFIAQEVEEVYPELVKTDKATGYKAVQYGNIVAILVEALKEEHKQRVRSIANVEEKADARMNQLEKENQELKARLERLEKFISEKVK